jgi:DHA2 family multidrug resistance protein
MMQNKSMRMLATIGLMVATLTNTLDMTIANIALPHIQGSVSASRDQMTWVMTSYLVATAVMTPASSWLAGRFGRKRLFLLSTALFMLASMLCGMATTLPQIVLFRTLQGLAGASMMPMSMAALLDLWPPRNTPQVMALWSAVVTAAPVIGPTLGGFLTDTLSWRWAFYINVPLDIIGFALVYIALPPDVEGQGRRFDYIGFTGLIMFTVGLQLMVDRGTTLDWFDSLEIWLEAIMAVTGLYVFIVQTCTARAPYFSRAIFRDVNFVTSNLLMTVIATALFTSSALIPIFLQQLLGYSAMQSGLALIPRGIGSVLAFVIVPWVAGKIGARPTIVIGMLINMVSLWQMGHFDLAMTSRMVEVSGFLQGFGSALMFNPIGVISYSTLPPQHRNEAAVLSNMMRSVAGSFGIAFYTAFELRHTATVRGHMVSHISEVDAVVNWRLPDVLGEPGPALAMLSGEVDRQSAMIGLNTAYGYMFISTLAILPLLFFLRPGKGVAAGPVMADAH